MKYYLGLDVGGTNFVAGIIDENYKIIEKAHIPAGAGRDIKEIIADMVKVSLEVVHKAGMQISDFTSWGIGMPSFVNPETNLLVHANCFGWKNVPIYSYLEPYIPLPIYIENDANCAALGETLAGGARGHENVLMLTLGTGLGGGIILNHKIYAGADMMGAELGHTKLVYNGEQCTCGQYGCAEAYCSATALIRQAKEGLKRNPDSFMAKLCDGDISRLEAKTVFEAMEQGDILAKQVIEQYIDYLSCAISSFVVIFRPEIIILGGGVANAGEILRKPLQERLLVNTYAGDEIGVPEIRLAECGNDAGLIGAAMLEKYGMDRNKKQGVEE
ncbi:ROK family protein [Faecalicatena acetigenes]|uniref:ROK family protein n=1 Tax=Faecalicatena acetigenes TaxID=2981790 RepID=A0ABT2TBQ7_9FIRM|nr:MULTISPECIES: ROK family protein [Lachnospiraceae]MCU6747312.1 ROK family protein [Faecalicatena acetigenes]SCH79033.1 Glucokinase [uncultured Clostridium sp.]